MNLQSNPPLKKKKSSTRKRISFQNESDSNANDGEVISGLKLSFEEPSQPENDLNEFAKICNVYMKDYVSSSEVDA